MPRCSKITDDALKHLAQGCPKLTSINLDGCSKITDEGLKDLAKGCEILKELDLTGCDRITRVMVWRLGCAVYGLELRKHHAIGSTNPSH